MKSTYKEGSIKINIKSILFEIIYKMPRWNRDRFVALDL